MGTPVGTRLTPAAACGPFSAGYAGARTAFLAAAHARGWIQESHEVDGRGPLGEALTVDVALSPPRGRDVPVLIVSSGLHGVEGAFGSASQVAALSDRGLDEAAAGVRVVLIHALNPYGFAWSRRTDGDNVDLNRAFVWDDMPHEVASGDYARLDRLLNPPRPPAALDPFPIALLWAALRSGPSTLRRTIASGQRTHPKGLFYAGQSVTPLQRLLDTALPRWIDGAIVVCHLDLHTGLGSSAEHHLIVDYPIAAAARAWMRGTFDGSPIVEAAGAAGRYVAMGSLGQWCVARRLAPDYCFAFAEFGTYGNRRILAALRAENQTHFWTAPDDPRRARATAQLRERFGPAAASWRARVVADAVALMRRAASGLGADRAGRPTMPHGQGLGEQGG